jgi:hypothetical protein
MCLCKFTSKIQNHDISNTFRIMIYLILYYILFKNLAFTSCSRRIYFISSLTMIHEEHGCGVGFGRNF